jgi:hypothetical protein
VRYTKSHTVCKHQAPFLLAPDVWIDADGHCGPKGAYGYMNNWHLDILQALHANHNVKFLTNGADTKDIA